MKRNLMLAACLLLTLPTAQVVTAGPSQDAPDYYRFTYDVDDRGRIVEDSVCVEYGGADWKKCRRYAQWFFNEKCWDRRLEMRRTSREAKERVEREMRFYCDAKSRVTPLG